MWGGMEAGGEEAHMYRGSAPAGLLFRLLQLRQPTAAARMHTLPLRPLHPTP